jgi:hypothetical protein
MDKYKIKCLETGELFFWDTEDMLVEINRDRSNGWTDYDETDVIEGWLEWVEGEFYTLVSVNGRAIPCTLDFFKEVWLYLHEIYKRIGIDKPSNHEDIVLYCCEDIQPAADPIAWHQGDVIIAFRRFLEKQ